MAYRVRTPVRRAGECPLVLAYPAQEDEEVDPLVLRRQQARSLASCD